MTVWDICKNYIRWHEQANFAPHISRITYWTMFVHLGERWCSLGDRCGNLNWSSYCAFFQKCRIQGSFGSTVMVYGESNECRKKLQLMFSFLTKSEGSANMWHCLTPTQRKKRGCRGWFLLPSQTCVCRPRPVMISRKDIQDLPIEGQ